MDLREELLAVIERNKKYAQEDREKATNYEASGNGKMELYMKGRVDGLELAIEQIEEILKWCKND